MRHHFVPQFLLRAWGTKARGGRFAEFRIDLNNAPPRWRSPKETGYKNDLWALSREEVAGMSKQAIEEHVFKKIDDYAAKVRAKIICQGWQSLTIDDRYDWVRFILSLRVRQPNTISPLIDDASAEFRASLADASYDECSSPDCGDPPTFEEWAEKHIPGLTENILFDTLPKIFDHPKFLGMIGSLRWCIWRFDTSKHELLLGDNPCVFGGSIDSERFVLALPLSPDRAFFATRGNKTAQLLHRYDPTLLAKRLNEQAVLQANEKVYARTKIPKRFIQNCVQRKTSGTRSS